MILAAMHRHCRAQALLYPLRRALPPVSRYFVEAPFRDRLDELDPERAKDEPVGIFQVRDPSTERGGFWLYVPESYDGTPWPLVVALHGGSGTGADFLWSWLSEARGRRFLLMAPTSHGSTWSLMGDDVDAPALCAMVDYVREGWKVDPERILLTGLSDGATYTLLAGLQEGMPFTAFAPVSGVLHPANAANGNLQRARGRRILIVHGALDWMFPVALARLARDDLAAAGAAVLFREVPDLSHAYPRDENDRILTWFDPSLALPRSPQRERAQLASSFVPVHRSLISGCLIVHSRTRRSASASARRGGRSGSGWASAPPGGRTCFACSSSSIAALRLPRRSCSSLAR